jgi:uracil-DNA glycosylase
MKLKDLNKKYDKLQLKYGSKDLDSIYNGGCETNPDICFVFMNPTGRNIASSKSWHGLKSPWIGTKNIWDLFEAVNLIDEELYKTIKKTPGSSWTEEFAEEVYDNVKKQKLFITNLGKCTQIDARPLPDKVYKEYLDLLLKEIEIINPKVIILFGNQVSSIVLNQKISVSTSRKEMYPLKINDKIYKAYSVYYPIGNGRFNIDKSIEDIKWIIENEIKEKVSVKEEI